MLLNIIFVNRVILDFVLGVVLIILVVLRIRPSNGPGSGDGTVRKVPKDLVSVGDRTYTFDSVLDSKSSQPRSAAPCTASTVPSKDQRREEVEQLFRDETMVEVYDLIENFCEYIINIFATSANKNDINEALSTQIFASARFGDLPELRSIRKLFGERYGQSFTTAALESLPGNLVNIQVTKTIGNKISSSDDLEMPVSIIEETERKIVYIDLLSEKQTLPKSAFNSSLQLNDMVKFTVSKFIGETNAGGMADESS
ncbi:unnamed protein product [Fraxinus pennsylvanica]|uniref:Uncharacterized protein n=1 Tax=Fraxinus pennsylvanica TaxID=56036 RepID=A0AAD2A366_9LAMI|nr:unnamed protein product [Fraxinus pennsylvanica]